MEQKMSLPNLDQNPNPDQNNPPNQDSNQQVSQSQPQQSNTPIAAYDPRLDSFMDEVRRTNQAILDRLNTPPQQQQPQKQAPQYNDDDFREKPATVISDLVSHAVTSAVDKLKSDINSQLSPVNEWIGQSRRSSATDGIISQLKGSPAFNRLNEPAVEQAFRLALSQYSGEINVQSMTNLYIYSIGAAGLGLGQNTPNQQLAPSNFQPPNQNIPAHLRPDPRPANNAGNIGLPPLDQNQQRIAKERGWSHARAAYMNKLISSEQYQKIEPQGKLIEGL